MSFQYMRAGAINIGAHVFSGTRKVATYGGQTLVNSFANIPLALQNGVQVTKWTLLTAGSLVKKTLGVGLMTIGYPLTAVSGAIGTASLFLTSGPCYTSFFSYPSALEQFFFPIKSTVQILEASTCPALASTTGLFLAITGGTYLIARTGYHLAVH